MRNIIEELYYGNICPMDRQIVKGGDYSHLLHLLTRNEDSLTETLTQAQQETFGKYKDCVSELNEANEVLSDPDKRARYDQFGFDGPNMGGMGGNPFGGMEFGDMGDIFSQIFGGGMGIGAGWLLDAVLESGAMVKAALVIAVFLVGAAIAAIRVTSVNVMKLMKVED